MNKYELLQWKFTACQHNIEGSNGFNTFSMSTGLTSDDKADLCRKAGTYTPPDGLPFTPTQEEIDKLFPVVFSSFPLRSGKHAVVRTVYVGQDYGGMRWGNFFSHALILPVDSWSFYPIQLFASSLFENGLTEAERATPNPDWLKPVIVEEENLQDFSAKLPKFFSDDSVRPKILASLLSAIRDGRQSGKPLILKDFPENIPFWIAAIQYAYPLRLARGITFTTHVHSLAHGERFHVTTTSDDKTIQVNSPTTTSANYVFDFSCGKFPEIPVKDNIYINEIKCNQAYYPGNTLRDMLPFIQSLHCEVSDNSLEKAILLYKFLEWNLSLDNQTLQVVLDFCFQQNITVKKRFVLKVLQKDFVYDATTLSLLLPKIMAVLYESPKDDDLWQPFGLFLVRQFERNVNQLTREDCNARFIVIDQFIAQNPKIGSNLVNHVHRLMTQTKEVKKYAFLYYGLILCLFNNDGVSFTDMIRFMPNFEKHELELFFDATLDFAVSKAELPQIHEQILALHAKHYSRQLTDDIAKKYIQKLSLYGLDRLKNRGQVKIQGLAFIKYVLELPEDTKNIVIFNTWYFCGIQRLFTIEGPPHTIGTMKKIVFESLTSQLTTKYKRLNSREIHDLKKTLIGHRTFWENCWADIKQICGHSKDFIFENWKVLLFVAVPLLFFLLTWWFLNDILTILASWSNRIETAFSWLKSLIPNPFADVFDPKPKK